MSPRPRQMPRRTGTHGHPGVRDQRIRIGTSSRKDDNRSSKLVMQQPDQSVPQRASYVPRWLARIDGTMVALTTVSVFVQAARLRGAACGATRAGLCLGARVARPRRPSARCHQAKTGSPARRPGQHACPCPLIRSPGSWTPGPPGRGRPCTAVADDCFASSPATREVTDCHRNADVLEPNCVTRPGRPLGLGRHTRADRR
jgi:hypothetical protein